DSLTHSDSALHHLVDLVGPRRVLLGSDFPADMGSPDPVQWILTRRWLTNADMNLILRGNFGELGIPEGPHTQT
ncbi:MAG: hypothetical protein WEC33_02150, partial [Dehalococcoidia bacterium]